MRGSRKLFGALLSFIMFTSFLSPFIGIPAMEKKSDGQKDGRMNRSSYGSTTDSHGHGYDYPKLYQENFTDSDWDATSIPGYFSNIMTETKNTESSLSVNATSAMLESVSTSTFNDSTYFELNSSFAADTDIPTTNLSSYWFNNTCDDVFEGFETYVLGSSLGEPFWNTTGSVSANTYMKVGDSTYNGRYYDRDNARHIHTSFEYNATVAYGSTGLGEPHAISSGDWIQWSAKPSLIVDAGSTIADGFIMIPTNNYTLNYWPLALQFTQSYVPADSHLLLWSGAYTGNVLLHYSANSWYVINVTFVNSTAFDVTVNGTLYDNGGAHYRTLCNYDLSTNPMQFLRLSVLGGGTEDANNVQADVYIDDISVSWPTHMPDVTGATHDHSKGYYFEPTYQKALAYTSGGTTLLTFSSTPASNATEVTIPVYITTGAAFIVDYWGEYYMMANHYTSVMLSGGASYMMSDPLGVGYVDVSVAWSENTLFNLTITTYANSTYDINIGGTKGTNMDFITGDGTWGFGPVLPISQAVITTVSTNYVTGIYNDFGASNETFGGYADDYDIGLELDWDTLSPSALVDTVTFSNVNSNLTMDIVIGTDVDYTLMIYSNSSGTGGSIIVNGVIYSLVTGAPFEHVTTVSGTASTISINIYQINQIMGVTFNLTYHEDPYINVTSDAIGRLDPGLDTDPYEHMMMNFTVNTNGTARFVVRVNSTGPIFFEDDISASGDFSYNLTAEAMLNGWTVDNFISFGMFVPPWFTIDVYKFIYEFVLEDNDTVLIVDDIVLYEVVSEVYVTGFTTDDRIQSMYRNTTFTVTGSNFYIDTAISYFEINSTTYPFSWSFEVQFNSTAPFLLIILAVSDTIGNWAVYTMNVSVVVLYFNEWGHSNYANWYNSFNFALSGSGTTVDPYVISGIDIELIYNMTVWNLYNWHGDGAYKGIIINSTDDVIVDNCTIRNPKGTGIMVINSTNVFVQNVSIYNCTDCIIAGNANSGTYPYFKTIDETWGWYYTLAPFDPITGGDGIQWYYQLRGLATGVKMMDSTNVTVVDCYFDEVIGDGTMVTVNETSGVIISNNTFVTSDLVMNYTGATTDNVNFTSNVIYNSTGYLFNDTASDGLTWVNNTYDDYFEVHPYTITTLVDGDVLEDEYELNGGVNDTTPIYIETVYNLT